MSRRQTPTSDKKDKERGGRSDADIKLRNYLKKNTAILIGIAVLAAVPIGIMLLEKRSAAPAAPTDTVSSVSAVVPEVTVDSDTDAGADVSSDAASALPSTDSDKEKKSDELDVKTLHNETRDKKKTASENVPASVTVVQTEQGASEPAEKKRSESSTASKSSDSPKPETDTDTQTDVEPEVMQVINHGVNFTELQEINPDIYAWIYIPNTYIDYPILQREGDHQFYLSANYMGYYEFAGSIYTEDLNSKDFTDPNTVVYGHNMLNGTMFRTLYNFRDFTFFEQNPFVYVYLPDRTLTYEVFSAYEYSNAHLLTKFDFNDRDVFAEYLEYATNPTEAMFCNRREIPVTPDDRIITLSTCLGNIETSRYLVQGVLISDEPATDTDKGE